MTLDLSQQRERDQPAIAPLHKTAGASPVPVVSQSSPPHQPIFLPHYRLLHYLLRRADAGGDDAGDQEEAGEHHAAAAAGGSK